MSETHITRAEQARRKIADQARQQRAAIIDKYKLTREDIERCNTLTPGDEVSDYPGNFEVQASIIAEERETRDLEANPAEQVGAIAEQAGSAALNGAGKAT